MATVIVIPARYGSSRLIGKPMIDINGLPMIQHVYERAKKIRRVDDVIVATDDSRIKLCVESFGGNCVMTSKDHMTGTDRVIEVTEQRREDIIVNIQGDEPLFSISGVEKMVQLMQEQESIEAVTLAHEMSTKEGMDKNVVKVIVNKFEDAIYFSRSIIPYPMIDCKENFLLRHVGIYGFRRSVLKYFKNEPPLIEKLESLEQLRLLFHGVKIRVIKISESAPGVDTRETLEIVKDLMKKEQAKKNEVLKNVRVVFADVDGVLTDGSVYFSDEREVFKNISVRDGAGIKMLIENNINVVVISGRDSQPLRSRLNELGVTDYELGVKNKGNVCKKYIENLGLIKDEIVSIGDDIADLEMFEISGKSFAVADAPEYIRQKAGFVLNSRGGEGAFRELADRILDSKGILNRILNHR